MSHLMGRLASIYQRTPVLFVYIVLVVISGHAMAVEEAEYTVIIQEEDFELRKYAPQVLAETQIEGDFADAGDTAFSRLFDYISGNNTQRQEIAMTAPVGQTTAGQEIAMTAPVGQQMQDGKWAVSFMLPASFSLVTAPEPKDSSVYLREIPARYMAAVRYSGFWSEEGYTSNKTKLNEWIAQKRLQVNGEPVWARYNPPFTPWFLRRNEVLIPVEQPGQTE